MRVCQPHAQLTGHRDDGLAVLGRPTRPALRSRTARRAVGAAAVVAAVTVGATRVLLGVHWASDVIAGWGLAVVMLVVAAGVLKRPTPRSDQRYKLDRIATHVRWEPRVSRR